MALCPLPSPGELFTIVHPAAPQTTTTWPTVTIIKITDFVYHLPPHPSMSPAMVSSYGFPTPLHQPTPQHPTCPSTTFSHPDQPHHDATHITEAQPMSTIKEDAMVFCILIGVFATLTLLIMLIMLFDKLLNSVAFENWRLKTGDPVFDESQRRRREKERDAAARAAAYRA